MVCTLSHFNRLPTNLTCLSSRAGTNNLWRDSASYLQEGGSKFPQEQKVLCHLQYCNDHAIYYQHFLQRYLGRRDVDHTSQWSGWCTLLHRNSSHCLVWNFGFYISHLLYLHGRCSFGALTSCTEFHFSLMIQVALPSFSRLRSKLCSACFSRPGVSDCSW